MEAQIKIPSRASNKLVLSAIPGHFATSHSHINYYIDITTIKTRVSEAKEAARQMYMRAPQHDVLDTIVCMDGTEMIGGFLCDEIEQNGGILTINKHHTMYVVSPEVNAYNKIIFRDNNRQCIQGKSVMLMLATTTTGETIRRAMECIEYYGGKVVAIASIFSTVRFVDGIPVDSLFDENDVLNYQAYPVTDCPFCKNRQRIEALVNGFGYSKL